VIERRDGLLPLLDQLDQVRVVRAEVGRRGEQRVAAVVGLGRGVDRVRGPRLEVLRQRVALGVRELLAEQARTHHAAVVADHRAVGVVVEGQLADADHDGGVDEPAQHGEHQQGTEPRDVLPDENGKAVHGKVTH